MGIKASILIAAYAVNKELPNVLHSISQQETDFEFEVCLLDDCSAIDPKPLFDEYLQVRHKKYSRLLQHIGNRGVRHNFKIVANFTSSYGHALLMAAPESEIIIVQSADVLWTQVDILQKLVDSMQPMVVQLCRVVNMTVDPDLHRDWKTGVTSLLEIIRLDEETKSNRFGDYQGQRRGPFDASGQNCEWYTFLIPFYKTDLLDASKLNYLNDNRDTTISGLLHDQGYEPQYRDDVIGVHQAHSPKPCVFVQFDSNLWNWSPHCPQRQEYSE